MKHGNQFWLALSAVLGSSIPLLAQTPQSTEMRLAKVEERLDRENQVEPRIAAKNVFFTDFSYLFWRAYEDGLEFVSTMQTKPSAESETISDTVDFEYNSGLRLGVGYRIPHDAWEIDLKWTRLHSRAYGTETPFTDARSSWIGPDVISDNSFWKGNLHIHLNVLDGEIARFFKPTSFLALKPHFGVRGLMITQKYRISSPVTSFSSGEEFVFGPASMEVGSRQRAVGLRAGVDSSWEFLEGWNLYGNLGGSLLAASFDLHSQTQIPSPRSSSFRSGNLASIHTTLVPTFDIAVGLGYEHSFNGKAALGVHVGWEFNDFFNQNWMRSLGISGTQNPSDLTYQGFTANVRVDF